MEMSYFEYMSNLVKDGSRKEIEETVSLVNEGKTSEERAQIFRQFVKDGFINVLMACNEPELATFILGPTMPRYVGEGIDSLEFVSVIVNAGYLLGCTKCHNCMDANNKFEIEQANEMLSAAYDDLRMKFPSLTTDEETEEIICNILAHSTRIGAEHTSRGELITTFLFGICETWAEDANLTQSEIDEIYTPRPCLYHGYEEIITRNFKLFKSREDMMKLAADQIQKLKKEFEDVRELGEKIGEMLINDFGLYTNYEEIEYTRENLDTLFVGHLICIYESLTYSFKDVTPLEIYRSMYYIYEMEINSSHMFNGRDKQEIHKTMMYAYYYATLESCRGLLEYYRVSTLMFLFQVFCNSYSKIQYTYEYRQELIDKILEVKKK